MRNCIFSLFILLPLVLAGTATAQTISTVAAVVNSEVVTTYQLERAVNDRLSRQNLGQPPNDTDRAELKRQMLEQLINEKLLQQRSAELGLRVSEQEVNSAIEDVKASNNLDQPALEAALQAEGMTLESYREQIRAEILRYKLMAQEVNYRAQVTSTEIRRYFEENIDQFDTQPRLHVSRISFSLPAERDGDAFTRIQAQAQESRRRLLAGDKFDSVLADAGALADGGIMGELVLADLAAPLQQTLRDLQAGEVSEPTELNRQLHLFIITDRRSGEELAFERARRSIEERLRREKSELRLVEWEEELRGNAYIDKRL